MIVDMLLCLAGLTYVGTHVTTGYMPKGTKRHVWEYVGAGAFVIIVVSVVIKLL